MRNREGVGSFLAEDEPKLFRAGWLFPCSRVFTRLLESGEMDRQCNSTRQNRLEIVL